MPVTPRFLESQKLAGEFSSERGKEKKKFCQVVFIIAVFLVFCFKRTRYKKIICVKKKFKNNQTNWQKINGFSFTLDRSIYAEGADIHTAKVNIWFPVRGDLPRYSIKFQNFPNSTERLLGVYSWLKLHHRVTTPFYMVVLLCDVKNLTFIP